MFRSGDRTSRIRSRAATALVAAVACAVLIEPLGITSAHADSSDSTTTPSRYPVVPLTFPVVPIVFPTQDLGRIAVVTKKPRSVTVRLDATVSFAKDSAVLRPQARARLRQVAAELRRTGRGKLVVQGFTDDLGTAQHGLVLSRQRASAAGSVLRAFLPVGSYPMVIQGLGESHFLVPNTSESNRRINRRVEITFTLVG